MDNTKINPGVELAALRKKVEKTCPICGTKFMGYPNTGITGCRTHAALLRKRNSRANKKPMA